MNLIALFDELPWIAALGWTLLHFLWQGAVVGVVFALLRASIPARHCNARYVNGLVALLAMAVLPVVTFMRLVTRQVLPVTGPTHADVAATSIASVGTGVATATASIDVFLPWIVLAWLVGVVLVGAYSWRQWRALVLVARKWAMPDPRLQAITAALARRFGFARHISVLVSDRIDTPTLMGWIKPVILLPTAVVLGFPRQQIELILAHELGHLRRYDHLVNLAQALLETVLFYHPVVHWIAREVRNEREFCCDELVLQVTRGEPREYASALAALEELRQPAVRLALAASGGVLLERVRRILFDSHPVATRSGLRLWVPVLALTTVTLAAVMQMDRSEPVHVAIPMPELMQHASSFGGAVLAVPDLAARILRPRFAVVDVPRPSVAAPVAESPPKTQAATRIALPATEPARVAERPQAALAMAQPSPGAAAPSSPSPTLPAAPAPQSTLADAAVDPVHEPAAPPPPVVPLSRKPPVATRTVAPEYPDSVSQTRSARVELNFTIGADGSVRNISLNEDSSRDAAFVRAATRALRQWRFNPASVEGVGDTRYRQDFVFEPEVKVEDGCVRRTGSLLCQRNESDSTQTATAAARADARDLVAATRPGGR